MNKIKDELGSQTFKDFYFYFLSDLEEDVIRKIAEFDLYDLIVSVKRLFMNFHCFER